MYIEVWALNYLQELICHKTKPNQTTKMHGSIDKGKEKKRGSEDIHIYIYIYREREREREREKERKKVRKKEREY